MSLEELIESISTRRKDSADGSEVVYNLTEGIDFSKPVEVAKALAETLFRNDVDNWFKSEGGRIIFNPKYKVKILLTEEHNKLMSRIVQEFLSDIKKYDISDKFAKEVRDIATNEVKLQKAMGIAALGSFFNKHFEKKDYKVEIEDQLFTQMLGYLEIKTPSGSDLIDWDRLPI